MSLCCGDLGLGSIKDRTVWYRVHVVVEICNFCVCERKGVPRRNKQNWKILYSVVYFFDWELKFRRLGCEVGTFLIVGPSDTTLGLFGRVDYHFVPQILVSNATIYTHTHCYGCSSWCYNHLNWSSCGELNWSDELWWEFRVSIVFSTVLLVRWKLKEWQQNAQGCCLFIIKPSVARQCCRYWFLLSHYNLGDHLGTE